MKTFVFTFLCLFSAFAANATTCAGATVIPAGATLPYTVALSCGSTNDITSANAPCGSNNYHGGNEAVFSWTPSVDISSINIAYTGVTFTGIFLYQGCPTSGGICLNNVTSSGVSKTLTFGGTLTAGVTYYIVIDTWPTPNSPCPGTLTLSKPTGNVVCTNPSPICTGTPIAFSANAGGGTASGMSPGNNYSCLTTSPNPSWYYLKIATSGNLVVDITAASDVDFAMWGPFSTLAAGKAACDAYGTPIACSYSTSATEHAVVNSTVAGQVYILLVTNFANSVQTITINQSASNTATTDCSIVPLPVDISSWTATYEDEKVDLAWVTQHEEGNRQFRIQRSSTGTIWETIGVKAGASTTTHATDYTFTDNSPLTGISYYRLQQVDSDGQTTFTQPLSVVSDPDLQVKIYPNPTTKYITIEEGKAKVSEISVTDLVGNNRMVQISSVSEGYTIDCGDLEAGIYFAEYTVNNKKVSRKFTVIPQKEL